MTIIFFFNLSNQPWTESNDDLKSCSEGDWKRYSTSMDKFSALMTEAAHSLTPGVELKMPDEQYAQIPATQTAFSKAAVDRCKFEFALFYD